MGKSYTPEFRKEALKLMGEIGKRETSKKLDVTEWTLNEWSKKAEEKKKAGESSEAQSNREKMSEMSKKIKELETENARIKKENEFLEEAARFFAGSRQK